MAKFTRAVYPGTFDPLTLGHEDIIRRASDLFSEVIVAVADSKKKSPCFTLGERVEMAAAAVANVTNVRVVGFSGLLADCLRNLDANVIVRGLRAVSDFEFEFQMAGMNRKLLPGVETLFLTPSDQYMFISATIVREIALLGGGVDQFVNPAVVRRLAAKVEQLGRPG